MRTTHGRVPISCAAITGTMVQGRWKSAKNGMKCGHGLNARIVGCGTAGQIWDRVLMNT